MLISLECADRVPEAPEVTTKNKRKGGRQPKGLENALRWQFIRTEADTMLTEIKKSEDAAKMSQDAAAKKAIAAKKKAEKKAFLEEVKAARKAEADNKKAAAAAKKAGVPVNTTTKPKSPGEVGQDGGEVAVVEKEARPKKSGRPTPKQRKASDSTIGPDRMSTSKVTPTEQPKISKDAMEVDDARTRSIQDRMMAPPEVPKTTKAAGKKRKTPADGKEKATEQPPAKKTKTTKAAQDSETSNAAESSSSAEIRPPLADTTNAGSASKNKKATREKKPPAAPTRPRSTRETKQVKRG
ncbi:hypothetical protein SISSUDRAFT_242158 [Sistotremastrum suecicum HHB10207 ss-3]|uniref:Uncharacterized protein n=1 Tax=Sistotremastrum suecicum HHB10207 ss-3 TaxID=1314776 RepID=A0A166A121_9AGAM|nr:hypothetical protein SISSUDRAFT_242158 [Sistotremastrum suecicum HHB10207 ss-3]